MQVSVLNLVLHIIPADVRNPLILTRRVRGLEPALCFNMSQCGIYKILSNFDGKAYIGKSIHIGRRFSNHVRMLNNNKHKNIHLQNAWQKHGSNNFQMQIIELCSEDQLDTKERYWIEMLKSSDKRFGYNKTSGGDGGRLDDESLARMAASLRGRKLSLEARIKLDMVRPKGPRPQWVKDKISKSKKGETKSAEHNKKISDALKGRTLSLVTRKRMSIVRKGKKQKILICPHCGLAGGTTMYRWHFGKCKEIYQ